MVRSIAANHALEDGNKRLAVTVLHSTLLVNGYTYLWSDDDAVELMLRCASGQTDYGWLSLFIEAWSAPGTRVALRADEIRDAIRFKRAEIEHRPSGFITGLVSDFLRSAASAHARGEVPEAAVRQYVDWLRTARAKFG